MKTKINVIDLDKTLIPYDTFRKFIMIQIKKMRMDVMLITLSRLSRLISQEAFKMKIIQWSENNCSSDFIDGFVTSIIEDIDARVYEKVLEETDSETTNVLVSASPDFYVQIIIDRLNWKGRGSFINSKGSINHLFGKNKILWVKENYPESEYDYNMSISDSSSDDELLKLFKKEIKWILP